GVSADAERGPITLAEKILALLGEGRFTATYKFAVLLGLIDLCLEKTSQSGDAPDKITTRQLAEKVVEIYWPHTAPYRTGRTRLVLRQSGGGRDTQAEILSAIERFRERSAPDPSAPLARARAHAPAGFERLVHFVEWKLIQMPLPRVQVMGAQEDRFLYEINWDPKVRKGDVTRYQKDGSGPFDNRILLKPGVGEHLVRLNGLLRPLIQRQWTLLVAQMNRLEETRLEEFLFGADRIPTDPVRPGLQELQRDRCFYCERPLRADVAYLRPQVDHFIPWARYPDNDIENLVVSHERCNSYKRDFLASGEHVERWRTFTDPAAPHGRERVEIARAANWATDPERTLGVARGIYLSLPEDARLWVRRRDFEVIDRPTVARALA
ncbi:MAG: HNH endonuclease, partial [Gemmatimonadota bacterium]